MNTQRYYTKVKSVEQIHLGGILAEVECVSNEIREIRLTDSNGGELIVRKGPYSDIEVLVPGPAPMKKAHTLTGTALGLPVEFTFQMAYQATQKRDELLSKCPDAVLEVKDVEIPEAVYDTLKG